ncbi:MAG TPA: hypothetical protein VIP09_16585 [Dehalococcoidia bacterium]|jgi:hypothetical protein
MSDWRRRLAYQSANRGQPPLDWAARSNPQTLELHPAVFEDPPEPLGGIIVEISISAKTSPDNPKTIVFGKVLREVDISAMSVTELSSILRVPSDTLKTVSQKLRRVRTVS